MSGRVRVRAPGKINLALAVGAPAGGYHPLATVFHAVDLYEDLRATPAAGITVRLAGRGRDLPTDGRNLAVRAAELLRARTGTRAGAALEITKAVPVAGGMAGGSADAAAALVACDALWGTGLSRGELHALAAELGSDVPFALLGGTATGHGRGEVLAPVPVGAPLHWVLALQDTGLATPAVFARYDELAPAPPEPAVPPGLLAALAAGDPVAVGAQLTNDLQEAALDLRPELGDVLAAFDRAGALGAVVSGSGPTVVALALDAAHAASVAAVVRGAEVASEVLTASGPASGVVRTLAP